MCLYYFLSAWQYKEPDGVDRRLLAEGDPELRPAIYKEVARVAKFAAFTARQL